MKEKAKPMKRRTRIKNENKPPTERQMKALADAGITAEPTSKLAAQALLSQHYRPRSRRGLKARREKTETRRNATRQENHA